MGLKYTTWALLTTPSSHKILSGGSGGRLLLPIFRHIINLQTRENPFTSTPKNRNILWRSIRSMSGEELNVLNNENNIKLPTICFLLC